MGQARILEPEDSQHAATLRYAGFRYCFKDNRWERNCKNPRVYLEEIKKELPDIKVDYKE